MDQTFPNLLIKGSVSTLHFAFRTARGRQGPAPPGETGKDRVSDVPMRTIPTCGAAKGLLGTAALPSIWALGPYSKGKSNAREHPNARPVVQIADAVAQHP